MKAKSAVKSVRFFHLANECNVPYHSQHPAGSASPYVCIIDAWVANARNLDQVRVFTRSDQPRRLTHVRCPLLTSGQPVSVYLI